MPFKIVRNDITRMKVDAIVNSANPAVAVGRGVDSRIYSAAGWDKLFREREKIGPMERGSAAITPGFDLDAQYIIHTVGPKWDPEDPEPARRQLRSCYDNAMSLAIEKGINSIAFPLISTGNYRFPKEEGLDIAFTTISKYLYTTEMYVYLVVNDEEAFSLSRKLLDDIEDFIGSRYLEEPVMYGGAMPNSMPVMPSEEPEAYRSAAPEKMPVMPSEAHEKNVIQRIFSREKTRDVLKKRDTAEISVLSKEEGPEFGFSEDMEELAAGSLAKYDSLEELLKRRGETFQERLFRFMDMSGKSDVEIYKGANLTKQTFSKIKKPGHTPKKRTILALAISMGLSVDDTKDLLASAGQAFSPSDKIDLVVQYCMDHGIYSIIEVERILFEMFGETLVS